MPGPYTISCRFLGADSISARSRNHPFPFNEVYLSMKARIICEPRCALLWRIDESYPNYAAIERAAKRYEVKLRRVADGDLGGIVGDLCAGKPAPAAAPLIAVPDRPAIIISGLRHDTGELGAFLDLVQAGGASIPVRSMVTPTSKGWTLANLLLELNTEHETVQGEKA